MQRDWTKKEKTIARKAFDLALARRNQQLVEYVNTTPVQSIADVWALLDTLQAAAKDIDRVFDYRYSQLDLIFPRLIHDGLLSMEELDGFSAERLESYQRLQGLFFDDEEE